LRVFVFKEILVFPF